MENSFNVVKVARRNSIFIVSLTMCALGFIRITFAGEWLANMTRLKGMLEYTRKSSEDLLPVIQISAFVNYQFLQPIAAVVLGVLELFLSFLVCCSCWCELQLMIRLMCVVLLVFAVILLAFIITAVNQLRVIANAKDYVTEVLRSNLQERYAELIDHSPLSQFTFDVQGLQVSSSCCGMVNFSDYTNATLWKKVVGRNLTVPETCCKMDRSTFLLHDQANFLAGNCTAHPNTTNSYLDTGCADILLYEYRSMLKTGSIMMLSISLVIQLIIVVLLACELRRTDGNRDGLPHSQTSMANDKQPHFHGALRANDTPATEYEN